MQASPMSCGDADLYGRYRLWSLYDMFRFYAHLFLVASRSLATMTATLVTMKVDGDGDTKIQEEFRLQLRRPLEELSRATEGLPLSRLLREKVAHLSRRLETDDKLTYATAELLFKEMHNDFVIDLSGSLFFMMPAAQAEQYLQTSPPFGVEVDNHFPDARTDIASGARCIALEEWTASVFHMMRAIETGLHYFARLLNVQVPAGIEYTDWWPIIQEAQKEIDKLKQLPRGPGKAESVEFYTQVAANFQYFKDGWRNNVAHPRKDYDERAAQSVWNHAKDFMQLLAVHWAQNP